MSRPSTTSPADIAQNQPVTRSRTLFFLSIRDSITPTHGRGRGKIKVGQYGDTLDIADNEEEERLIEGSGHGGGKGLPPKWYV
jgi:syntaxin 16